MDNTSRLIIIDDNEDNGRALIRAWRERCTSDQENFAWIHFGDSETLDEGAIPVGLADLHLNSDVNYLPARTVEEVLNILDNLAGNLLVCYDLELKGTEVYPVITKKLAELIQLNRMTKNSIVVLVHSSGDEAEAVVAELDSSGVFAFETTALSSYSGKNKKKHALVMVNKILEDMQKALKPLQALWSISEQQKWFKEEGKAYKATEGTPILILHSANQIIKLEGKQKYRADLEKVLGFPFPSEWFEDDISFDTLHEHMKSLCGTDFKKVGGKYNLTVGSVYLISLMAHYNVNRTIYPLVNAVRSWKDLSGSKHQFLSKAQSSSDAEETSIAIFELFEKLFCTKVNTTSCMQPDTPELASTLEACSEEYQGKKLRYRFCYEPTEISINAASMASNLSIPLFSSDSTTALCRAVYCIHFAGKTPFINPGTIFIPNSTFFPRELHVSSANSIPLSALVICSDEDKEGRTFKWAELLSKSGTFGHIYASSGDNNTIRFDHGGFEPASRENIPKAFSAAFIHESDMVSAQDILAEYRFDRQFVFSKPGDPIVADPFIPIMRPTSPIFDLYDYDAKELADFVCGDRKELPSCCQKKDLPSYLIAFSILCQGYLLVHALHQKPDKNWSDKDIDKALDLMGWNNIKNTPTAVKLACSIDDVRAPAWWKPFLYPDSETVAHALKNEWEQGEPLNLDKTNIDIIVNLLIKSLPVSSPKLVADAYIELHAKLNGTHWKWIKENPLDKS